GLGKPGLLPDRDTIDGIVVRHIGKALVHHGYTVATCCAETHDITYQRGDALQFLFAPWGWQPAIHARMIIQQDSHGKSSDRNRIMAGVTDSTIQFIIPGSLKPRIVKRRDRITPVF